MKLQWESIAFVGLALHTLPFDNVLMHVVSICFKRKRGRPTRGYSPGYSLRKEPPRYDEDSNPTGKEIESEQLVFRNHITGVETVSEEFASPVPPARLFKALILDSSNLIPKLMPQIVKIINVYPLEGGVSSIQQINFAEGTMRDRRKPKRTGNELGSVKNRVEELNEETLTYKYALIEGGPLLWGKIETITFEAKLVPAADRGTSTYYTKGDADLGEDKIKSGKEVALRMLS